MFQTSFTTTTSDIGKRIDVLAAEKFSQISRSRWTSVGIFTCDGKTCKASTKVKADQQWDVTCEEQTFVGDHVDPWDFPLTILKESASWVVIEKPVGISVHPSPSEKSQETIVNALVHKFGKDLAENFDEIDGQKIPRPGLVHRLDKTTSGILLVAKTDAAHAFFQSHWPKVEKYYTALVTGTPPAKGNIVAGILRDPHDRKKMTVSDSPDAKSARTSFETIESQGGRALLRVKLHTGRTHQIRVHLSSIGFPIVGDELYGGPAAERVFLHATTLKFPDPDEKGKVVEVKSEVEWELGE